jgi:hypothetical protein
LIQIGACVLAVTIQAAALCLAECVEVVVAPEVVVVPTRFLPDNSALIPFLSSRVVRLALIDDGKPTAGAKVELYLIGSSGRAEKPIVILVSDRSGLIKSPKLSEGLYEIVAMAESKHRADILLEISSHYGRRATAFKMELQPIDVPHVVRQHVAPQVATFPNVAIENHLQVFRGTIVDPSGAVIPGASIHIFRQGTEHATLVQELKAGQSGEFEAKLDYGTYVAQFSSPGFSTKLLGFEILDSASEALTVTLKVSSQQLIVTLKLASC